MNRNDFDNMLDRAKSFSRENDADAVLFLGQPADPIPRALIQDADLSSWARLLWCFLRSYSDSPDSARAAPTYKTIQNDLGIKSRGTVSSAIHSLRVTRWITLMSHSENRRHVYLLHNAPLTFQQAVELDADYTDRIKEALRSPSKHVRKLAQRVLDGAIETADTDSPLTDLFRLAAVPTRQAHQSVRNTGGWNLFNMRVNDTEPDIDVPVPEESAEGLDLVFHQGILGLTPSMEKLARIKLEHFPAEHRQALLDDVAVRVLEQRGGDNPVRKPLGYIVWTVNRYLKEGDLALDGRGEQLPRILQNMEARQKSNAEKPLREEMTRLMAERQHIQRLSSYDSNADPDLLDQLGRMNRRIEELQSQLGSRANGAH